MCWPVTFRETKSTRRSRKSWMRSRGSRKRRRGGCRRATPGSPPRPSHSAATFPSGTPTSNGRREALESPPLGEHSFFLPGGRFGGLGGARGLGPVIRLEHAVMHLNSIGSSPLTYHPHRVVVGNATAPPYSLRLAALGVRLLSIRNMVQTGHPGLGTPDRGVFVMDASTVFTIIVTLLATAALLRIRIGDGRQQPDHNRRRARLRPSPREPGPELLRRWCPPVINVPPGRGKSRKSAISVPNAVALAFLALVAFPVTSYAQDECGSCTDHLVNNEHVATEATPETDPKDINANKQDGWHSYLVKGQCWEKHGICVVYETDEEQLTAEQLTAVIMEAVHEKDVHRLASLASAPAVRLVANRAAIQITGCDGEAIVGHIPVAFDLLSTIGARVTEQLAALDS